MLTVKGPGLWERLKALAPWGRVPYFQQQGSADCGPTCLRMVLSWHGHYVGPLEMRELFGTGRDGATARSILEVATRFGLIAGSRTQLALNELPTLECPVILHWNFNHFVVLERLVGERGLIVDPARGKRWAEPGEIASSFTGVALTMQPGPAFSTRHKPWPRLDRYIGVLRQNRSLLLAVGTITVVLQAFALAAAKLTQIVVDDIVPTRDSSALWYVLIGMGTMAGIQAAISFVRASLLNLLRAKIDEALSVRFFKHLLSLPFSFFEQRSIGDVMMRLNSSTSLRDLISSRIVAIVLDASSVLVIGAILVIASPGLGVLVGILGGARLVTLLAIQPVRRELLKESIAVRSEAQSVAVESLVGILTLKASGMESSAFDKWRRLFMATLTKGLEVGTLTAATDTWVSFLGLLSPTILLVYLVGMVLDGSMTLGQVFALLGLAGHCIASLGSLAGTWEAWQEAAQYIERIDEVESNPPEQPHPLPVCGRLSGHVSMEGVSFKYAAASPPVLTDVTLSIAPGSFVAIVGRSGSGKSTVVKLLVGLYPPTSGVVRFGNYVTTEVDLTSLRNQLGCLIQDSRIFAGSLSLTIAGGHDVSIDRVRQAASLAEIDSDIVALPLGYDTVLSEGGSNMSGGQRQRLALARALVAEPVVLIADEATSALDAETERRVHARLKNLGITRIVVTHRLTRVVEADEIFVLADGKVVQRGTHDQLIQQPGEYALLYKTQVGNGPA